MMKKEVLNDERTFHINLNYLLYRNTMGVFFIFILI